MLTLTFTGTTPLVLHNGELADDENPFAIQIAEILAVKPRTKITPEQRALKHELHWRGSLYVLDGKLVFPTQNIRKALVEAGRVAATKSRGPDVERAVFMRETFVPLVHDGPDDVDELWKLPQYRFRTCVNPNPTRGNSKIASVRPIFHAWSLTCQVLVMTDVLGREDFEKIFDHAGRSVGIGDGRRIGMGRFEGKVTG